MILRRKSVAFKFDKNELQILKGTLTRFGRYTTHPNDETELHCDASSIEYGAMLMQA